MGSVIKGHGYRLIDNRSFELPLPVKYELLKEDDLIALYEISPDEKVSYTIITKYKENMLTPINRPLEISDMYYFLSSRVFQNGTPFTAIELQLLGLEKYNVFDIVRKTRGVTPYDTYWLRFDGDECDYSTARASWEELTSRVHPAEPQQNTAQEHDPFSMPGAIPFVATSTRTLDSDEISHVGDILNQHKMNFDDLTGVDNALAEAEEIKSAAVSNNTMSADEIEALLMKSGLGDGFDAAPEPVKTPKSGGGTMSQEDIEKMLAAAAAPAEEPKSGGGKMSQEYLEKMLAAAAAPEPEPAPVEEPKPSGG
ncbi:MAG: MucR family transcriptional regulator, partial [Oscillospiraceae bacterium]|nr:MucR family transcriptional regulator [Oscillospiraceae bacterium]